MIYCRVGITKTLDIFVIKNLKLPLTPIYHAELIKKLLEIFP